MDASRIQTTQGHCVVALTRHLMTRLSLSQDEAYRKLINLSIYAVLMEPDSNLYLETNDYLCEACDVELDCGADAVIDYINE